MVFTKKFSEFAQGNVADPVGLTNGVNTIGQGGDDSSGGVIITIDQDTTGLFASRWVRFDNATQLYVDALANTPENAEVVGVVLEVLSGSQFKLQQSGYIQSGTAGFSGFSTDGVYFLSDVAQGQQTLNVPTENGHIRLPLFVADSTDSGWICNLKSGMVIGSPGAITGGGSTPGEDSSIHQVSQPGNGFGVGDWVRVSGNSVYSLASGATFADSQGVGVVIDDGDPLFTIQFSGFNENSIIGAVDALGAPIPLVSATVYYLSDVVPGKITPVKPTDTLTSVKPCFISESSTMLTGYILPQQPLENVAGEDSPSVILVNQATAGLAVENVMRVSGNNVYAKAQADSLANSRAVGIITEIIDANNFVLQTSGFTNKFSAKTPAAQYYLSATNAGELTTVEPTSDGQISKPMFQALTATSGYILEQRPLLQPSANGGGGSGGGGSWEEIEVIDITNDAVIEILNLNGSYLFVLQSLTVQNNNVILKAQVGTGAGPTYQTTNYQSCLFDMVSSTGSTGQSVATDGFLLSDTASANSGLSNIAGATYDLQFYLHNTGNASIRTLANYNGVYVVPFNEINAIWGGGQWMNTTAVTAIRFQVSSGNIVSGKIGVYKLSI